jgi:S-adenosylmethionine:tRNA ribosyltransferase-isomerase
MHLNDFNYTLPPDLIAQYPLKQRDACKLLKLDRGTGALQHSWFKEVSTFLHSGDLLVLNDTRVMPVRLACRRSTGGAVEVFFTRKIDDLTWKALLKPARRLHEGSLLSIEGDPAAGSLIVKEVTSGGERVIGFSPGSIATIEDLIRRHGVMPLPPYIRRKADENDLASYQTVFAVRPGAVAAPTAGLHFTPELLKDIQEQGTRTAYVTLHVGIGTFLPVKVSDPRDHVMHEEEYELKEETAKMIQATKKQGGRIIAVGTTVVRVLEHCAQSPGGLCAGSGRTSLKILPPWEFKVVDGLITNFHLPQSTLLMLVSAFSSIEHIKAAYTEAIRAEYRFYSYGDAMLII